MNRISEDALIHRVNARIHNGVIRRCSPRSRWFIDLGRYYKVCPETNSITETHLNLMELAVGLGVIPRQTVVG